MQNSLLIAIRKGLRWLAIISLIPIALLVWIVALDVWHFLSLSPFIRDIAHDPQHPPRSPTFDARVKATFQNGMKEEELVQQLKGMGFSTSQRTATTFEPRSKCRFRWTVYWDATPTGEVTNVQGQVTCRGNVLGAAGTGVPNLP